MASKNKTANYGLNQWERTDGLCMDDFNIDNAKLDMAVGKLESRAKIAVGSYKGTGVVGDTKPTTLTFDFTPKFVWVMRQRYGASGLFSIAAKNGQSTARIYSSSSGSQYEREIALTWAGNSLSWVIYENADYGMNANGEIYNYVAIG